MIEIEETSKILSEGEGNREIEKLRANGVRSNRIRIKIACYDLERKLGR